MVKIPDAPDFLPEEGAGPSTAAITPTDFGLGAVSQSLAGAAEATQRAKLSEVRAQAQADKRAVQPYVLQLRAQNDEAYAAEAGRYNGEPDFAIGQFNKAHERAQAIAAKLQQDPSITPGQKAEFDRAAHGESMTVGNAAATHAAAFLARPIAEASQNARNAQVATAVTQANAYILPTQQQAFLDHVPGQTDLGDKVNQIYQSDPVTQVRSALPAALQPDFDAKIQAQWFAAREDAFRHTIQTAEQGNIDATGKNLATLTDTVFNAPTGFDAAMGQLPGIVSALPAGQQQKALRAAQQNVIEARVHGLIQAGHPAVAFDELKGGKYNAYLTPEQLTALEDGASAAARANAPMSAAQALAQDDLRRRAAINLQAQLATGKATGQVSDAEVTAALPLGEAAKYLADQQLVQKEFAAAGPVKQWSMTQLQTTAQAAPDPTQPDYELQMMRRQAAQQELAQRQSPGAWAFNSNGKGLPAGAKGPAGWAAALSQDRGAALGQLWQETQAGTAGAAQAYASAMLSAQQQGGIPSTTMQILPDSEAQRLAATVAHAAPDTRAGAMASLAQLAARLPASVKLPDGSTASPRALLARQLIAKGLSQPETAAVINLGDDPVMLGRAAAAMNDPKATAKLDSLDEKKLQTEVNAVLGPYFASTAPMGGADLLSQGQRDLTLMIARHLVTTQNMAPAPAARTAAGQIAAGYQYQGTWRMPLGEAQKQFSAPNGFPGQTVSGATLAQIGMGKLLTALTADHGAAIGIPPGHTPATVAAKVQHAGQWFTTPDENGVQLMTPYGDGSWDTVRDRYGRPVRATWDELRAQAQGAAKPGFTTPPQNVLKAPDGTPAPALSRQQAFDALSWAITRRESGFHDGLTSDQGAMGRMQVLPGTAEPYAQKLFGAPLDKERLLHDGDYNSRIGKAHLADLVNHFGSTPEGVVLATAAYFGGQGNIEGYTDAKGYHPGVLQTVGDPRTGRIGLEDFAQKLPPKTRAYVLGVVPAAAQHALGRP